MVDLPRIQPTVRPVQQPATGLRPDPALVERGAATIAGAEQQRAAAAGQLALRLGAQQGQALSQQSEQLFDLAKKQQAAIETTQALRIASEAHVALETGMQALQQDKTLDPVKLTQEATALYDRVYGKAAKEAGGVSEAAMRYVDQQLLTRRASVLTAAGTEANKRVVENMAGAIQTRRSELLTRFDQTTNQDEADGIRRELSQLADLAQGAGVSSPAEAQRLRERDNLEMQRSIYARLGEKDPTAAAKLIKADQSLRDTEKDAILGEVYQRLQRKDAQEGRAERMARREQEKEQELTRLQVVTAFGQAGQDVGKLLELKQVAMQMATKNPEKIDPQTLQYVIGHVDAEVRRQEREGAVEGRRRQIEQQEAATDQTTMDAMNRIRRGEVKDQNEVMRLTQGMPLTNAQRVWTVWEQEEKQVERRDAAKVKGEARQGERELRALARGVPRWLRELHGIRQTDPNQSVEAVTERIVGEYRDALETEAQAGTLTAERMKALRTEYTEQLQARLPSLTMAGAPQTAEKDVRASLLKMAEEKDPERRNQAFAQWLARQYAAKLKRESGKEPSQADLLKAMQQDPTVLKMMEDPALRRAISGK